MVVANGVSKPLVEIDIYSNNVLIVENIRYLRQHTPRTSYQKNKSHLSTEIATQEDERANLGHKKKKSTVLKTSEKE